ncbi:AraC family transcriptional regulator [Winogradskyella sp. SYSU M77433]|uniref:helix-turn-helix domain-containing protein n=1 Tax=Winogradskyella sp. SYSU M77433 TaxID=3042722 RepID=UPI0024810189|nr:AraC family transcriptional regulator [Winogradskyella sp. SYSU M77433]MDH7912893.1 AraC family transcriptional regulator [Winogradskyella sp. SYSU M77433]
MKEILISANSSENVIDQFKYKIGGEISEDWGETVLTVNNNIARGSIRIIHFDFGIHLLIQKMTYFEDVIFKVDPSDYNPLRFIYCLKGEFLHKFGIHKEEKLVEQFQSLIFSNKSEGVNYLHYKKDVEVETNIIQIERKEFLQKKTAKLSSLNKQLKEIFTDTNHENRFVHHGMLNLKMADFVEELHETKTKNMTRILKMEAKVYEIISMHIQEYSKQTKGVPLPTSLVKSELKKVRKLGEKIKASPSVDYNLEDLSAESGLSQAKLQDGFKFLYTKTVTEYIRHIRLESARHLLRTTDLNISQVVYTIGFTSRSYFSKIFKEKYGVTPNQFKKQIIPKVMVA